MSEKIEKPENALQDAQTAHQVTADALAKARADSKGAVDHLEELKKALDAAIEADAQAVLDGGKPGKSSGEALRHNIAVQERIVVALEGRQKAAADSERAARMDLLKAQRAENSDKLLAAIGAVEKAQENLDACKTVEFELRADENRLRRKWHELNAEIAAANPAPAKPKPVAFSVQQTIYRDAPPPTTQLKQTVGGKEQPMIIYKQKPPMSKEDRERRERQSA